MKVRYFTAIAVALVLSAPIAKGSDCHCTGQAGSEHKHKADIVDTAVSAGQFDTLVAAVKAAGLVDALKGEGPLTVFAPTDAAFASLPEGTVESLLKPENKQQLIDILMYHVVPGKVMAENVLKMDGAQSLNGQRVSFSVKNGSAMIGNAKIIKTDIEASNGVIHVINSVILPSEKNIVTTASDAGIFNTLLTAATEAGLAEALQGDGPFTVFAPTDEAFGKLPAGTVETLLKPENKDQLASILKYHVVQGRVYSGQAIEAGNADTLLGKSVNIEEKYGKVSVNGAQVVKADIDASNGVIHVIDSVIIPD